MVVTVVYTAKQKLFKQFTTFFSVGIFSSYCCLYCEAETFQAIHNLHEPLSFCLQTVVYTAKQKLFKQFTTKRLRYYLSKNCCLYCEAETFQAIHNAPPEVAVATSTVVYTAKQKLFKQFTTDYALERVVCLLLFILRSRNFSSNSQLGLPSEY